VTPLLRTSPGDRAGLPALVLATLLLAACDRTPDALARFRIGPAERFYAIELAGELAGRMHETRSIDVLDRPTIRVVTLLDLPGGGRLVRRETRRFAADPPHRLLATDLWQRGPDGHVDERSVRAGPASPTLADSLDPGSQAPVAADGTTLSVRRDADGSPLEYRIGASFRVTRTDDLPPLPEPAGTAPLRMPVGTARTGSDAVTALSLRLSGPAAELLADRLDVRAPPPPDPELGRQLRALLSVVGERLEYAPGAAPQDLDALLARGAGDCHEFALLFDALAEGLGLESEIVTGLAWSPAEPEAFVPHAWNRVRAGDDWVVVDPTWGRIVTDADRVPFPAAAGRQLDLQLALQTSRLDIVAIDGEPALSPDGP
jgi:hypothetical protein